MRIAKHIYSLAVLALSLGLLYSQVCNFICVFSYCSDSATARKVAKTEHTGHCHQDQQAPQPAQPSDAPHKCPAHDPAVSILPLGIISTAVSHPTLQPAAAEVVPFFDISFDFTGSRADQGSHFRSPPRRPQFTVLRI